jgi:biopolymer transport protein ExbD
MKPATKACLVGTILVIGIGAQAPAMKKGVSVDLPVARHAVETREADDPNALVVAITGSGRIYVGTEPSEPAALSKLSEGTAYVKVDVRAPYQTVLAVWTPSTANRWFSSAYPPKPRRGGDMYRHTARS